MNYFRITFQGSIISLTKNNKDKLENNYATSTERIVHVGANDYELISKTNCSELLFW